LNIHPTNLCIRCGTPRIITKTWRKGNIIFSNFVCPNRKCQKIVDEDLKKKKNRLDTIRENALRRRTQNIRKRKKR